MIKKLINFVIFVFIFALYFVTFLMIYDNFRERKLSEMEKDALNVLEKKKNVEIQKTEQTDEISVTGVSYGNFTVLGKLEIPSVGISTVILKEHSHAAMNVGAIKTYGVELNEEGGFIISGHNFRGTSTFLYNIKNLVEGNKIYITDVNGMKMEYTVYSVQRYVDPTDTSFYKEFDGYHVVISTCENGGKTRIIVMARVDG